MYKIDRYHFTLFKFDGFHEPVLKLEPLTTALDHEIFLGIYKCQGTMKAESSDSIDVFKFHSDQEIILTSFQQ